MRSDKFVKRTWSYFSNIIEFRAHCLNCWMRTCDILKCFVVFMFVEYEWSKELIFLSLLTLLPLLFDWNDAVFTSNVLFISDKTKYLKILRICTFRILLKFGNNSTLFFTNTAGTIHFRKRWVFSCLIIEFLSTVFIYWTILEILLHNLVRVPQLPRLSLAFLTFFAKPLLIFVETSIYGHPFQSVRY